MVRVVEVVVPRGLLLDDLGVWRARLAQLVPRAHDAVQPRALFEDAVPIHHLLNKKRIRVVVVVVVVVVVHVCV